MTTTAPAGGPTPGLDGVAAELTRRRTEAGLVSYGDLAGRVSRLRQERGLSAARARVGRTTVYDAFRTGRRRIDLALVSDLVLALGGTQDEADALVAQARVALAEGEVPAEAVALPTEAVLPVQPVVSAEPAEPVVPAPAAHAAAAQTPTARPSAAAYALVLVAALAINLLGRVLVDALGLPVYLDMVGTAGAAIALGPWWGALVGSLTNVAGVGLSGEQSLWFTPVNVVGALVWGYGIRRWRLGASVPRFFALNVLVAAACTAFATPVILALGGTSGHSSDGVTQTLLGLALPLWSAVALSNLLYSVVDKLLCGFFSLAILEALPSRWAWLRPPHWQSSRSAPPAPEPAARAAPAG